MINSDYLWIVIVGGFAAFFASMGIGANDVANAFATSVGSRALTIKNAVVIASIFECAGAIFMGSHVTNTIRKSIADYQCFESNPELLMYGCMCVLFAVGLWLFIASYFEMPVSTTHSCVGGMVGMTMMTGGVSCVNWYSAKDTFPYVDGVLGIVLSWFISPIMAAIICGFIFLMTRLFVLRKKNSFARTFMSIPIYVGLTLVLNTFFIIYKGAKGLGLANTPFGIAVGVAFGIGGFVGIVMIPFLPRLKNRVEKKYAEKEKELEKITNQNNHNNHNDHNDPNNERIIIDEIPQIHLMANKETKNCYQRLMKHMRDSLNYNVENDIIESKEVSDIHNNAEKFGPKTEESFKYLQIFTAICASFSHGANDVANAIGPFAAIFMIWSNGAITKKADMDNNAYWVLALGGLGIVFGLILYGYKIIRAIGVKICKITPSRGFAIELGTATVIILGSRLGIPLSTTHCQIGGTMGVASLEDFRKCSGINWKVIGKSFLGWFLTLIIVGGTTALFVAMGIYAPTVVSN
jgi:solute carrier family 20 (sodium-dependent phosphate transporter)